MTDTNKTDETNVDAYLRHHFRTEPALGKHQPSQHALANQEVADDDSDEDAGIYPVPLPNGRVG